MANTAAAIAPLPQAPLRYDPQDLDRTRRLIEQALASLQRAGLTLVFEKDGAILPVVNGNYSLGSDTMRFASIATYGLLIKTGIDFTAYAPSSPSDGQLWWDGTEIRLHSGGATWKLQRV